MGQAGDEVVGTHPAGSSCHLIAAAAPRPIGDVVVEGAGKEQRLLGDDGHLQERDAAVGVATDGSGTAGDGYSGDMVGNVVMLVDPDNW